MKQVWMFYWAELDQFATDCIADSEETLIERACKTYNKTPNEVRAWLAKPVQVELRVTGHPLNAHEKRNVTAHA